MAIRYSEVRNSELRYSGGRLSCRGPIFFLFFSKSRNPTCHGRGVEGQ